MNFKNESNLSNHLETIDLKKYYKLLVNSKKFLLAIVLAFVVLASIYLILLPAIYAPSALIQVNSQSSSNSFALNSSAASTLGLGGGGQASQDQVEMALMHSSYILQPVVQKLNLDVSIRPKYFPLIGSYVAHHYNGEGAASAKFGLPSFAWGGESWSLGYFLVPIAQYNKEYKVIMQENKHYALYDSEGHLILNGQVGTPACNKKGTVQVLWNSLELRPGTVLYLKKLSMVETLKRLGGGLQLSELSPGAAGGAMATQNTGLIQLTYKSANPELAASILNAIVEFTYEDNLASKTLQSQKTLSFIEKQLPIAKQALTDSETSLNSYQAKNGNLNFTEESKLLLAEFTALNQQILQTKALISQYSQSYTDENPLMQSLLLQAKGMEHQKTELQHNIAALPLKDQSALNLALEVRAKQQAYNMLLVKNQQYQLEKAGTLGDIRILQPASVPDEALSIPAFLILLAAAFLGLVVGALIIILRHCFKDFVTDPYWAEKEFNIRTIGVLPFSINQMQAKKDFDEKRTKAIKILALNSPNDICIEAIRSLRTSLFFSFKEKKTNILNITGVTPGSGKSFVSVNLAVILAQTGKRVLLIDADMRRGYLNHYFGTPHAAGLSELLTGTTDLNGAIHKIPVQNLDMMPTGVYPDYPSELLLKEEFTRMLKAVSEGYDAVVIDSPPILAVNDASVIAQEVALNYLVIPGGELKTQEIETAVRRFHNDGISLSGTLFNFVKEGAQKISSHSYHHYTKLYQKATDHQTGRG